MRGKFAFMTAVEGYKSMRDENFIFFPMVDVFLKDGSGGSRFKDVGRSN